MRKIILASASPRRYELLTNCGLKFKVIASHIYEKTFHVMPHKIVVDLAVQKAKHIALKQKNAVIIGADTIVVLNGSIIGKPRDKKHAREILKSLSNTIHRVYTGIAVVDSLNNKTVTGYEVSRVKMRKIEAHEFDVLCGKHMDKAGAYAVQEKEDRFVEKIYGDYFNVVGLPLKKLAKMLASFNVILKTEEMYKSI